MRRRHPLLLLPPLSLAFGIALVGLPALPALQPSSSRPPPVHISSDALTTTNQTVVPGWSRTVTGDTDLVGVEWQGDPAVRFTIEKQDQHGQWSRARDVGIPDFGPDPGSPEARRHPKGHVSEPVWLGDAKAVRVRVVNGAARAVDLHKVQVPRASTSSNAADAASPQPAIISRAQWGADESLRLRNCPGGPDYDATVNLAVVHHTDNDNNYSPADSARLMRGVYAYHTQALGYCDIAYNFLVDRYGQVFEGRFGGITAAVHGAHAIGFNTNTTGIATIGNFQDGAPPPAMVGALEWLIAWKLDVHGVDPTSLFTYVTAGNDKFPPGTPVTVPRIIGHRDTWFTDCPGQFLYALLPQIRADVTTIMARSRAWTGWGPLGGTLASGTATASWAPFRLDVFAESPGDTLVHAWWDNVHGWSSWEDRGGALASAPAAVSWGPNRVDVFATASDGSLRHLFWDGTQWSSWENLGGQLASGPAVASWASNRLDVFARATNGQLEHKFWESGRWSGWEQLGGNLVGDPAAVSWSAGRIDVFVSGADKQLYHKWYDGSRWVGWEPLGGILTAGPTASSWSTNRLDVFVRGTDNQLWHKWYDGGRWVGYEPLGGLLTADPSAVSRSWDRIDVFVRGTDDQLWHKDWG